MDACNSAFASGAGIAFDSRENLRPASCSCAMQIGALLLVFENRRMDDFRTKSKGLAGYIILTTEEINKEFTFEIPHLEALHQTPYKVGTLAKQRDPREAVQW